MIQDDENVERNSSEEIESQDIYICVCVCVCVCVLNTCMYD